MLAKLTARGIVASTRRDGVRFAFHVYNTLEDVNAALTRPRRQSRSDGAFMKVLAGGCRVYSAEDGQFSTLGNWTARTVISQKQRRPAYHANGERLRRRIIAGRGESERRRSALRRRGEGNMPRRRIRIQPQFRGWRFLFPRGPCTHIENTGAETLRIVSACCPEDPRASHCRASAPAASGDAPRLLVHEDLREDIRAGQDRLFRYLVYTDLGCKQITQFAGWIPPSKAPFHYHTYEEGIFILEGHGIVHADEESCEFGPGSSIYFPIGVRHCVENPGTSTIKLLGAFYPSGSPGAAYEDD